MDSALSQDIAKPSPRNLRLDSASLFDAAKRVVGDWSLAVHEFDPQTDEVRVSYDADADADADGAGRVSLLIGFEADQATMADLLRQARPAG